MELTTKYGARVEVQPVYFQGQVAGYVGQLDEHNWVAFSVKGTHLDSTWVHSIRPNANTAVIEHYRRQLRFQAARRSPRKSRPRDSQRGKLYAAEREAFADFPAQARTAASARQWALGVAHLAGKTASDVPVFRSGRGNHFSWIVGFNGNVSPRHIQLSIWGAQRDWVVVHELAHAWDYRNPYESAGHDAVYAALYLDLVNKLLGRAWGDKLTAAFTKHGVKYRAPRAKRQLTEEQRAALRERLAVARAAKQAKENA